MCDVKDPWERWFAGFFRAVILGIQPNVIVFHRSHGNQPLIGEAFNETSENSTQNGTLQLHSEMCFSLLVRQFSADSFYRGISKSSVFKFKSQAYQFSRINDSTSIIVGDDAG